MYHFVRVGLRYDRTQMSDVSTQLNTYYEEVKEVILAKQHPITGLLPASTDVNEHGDYRDAWVRDNVYSIVAVWALALAYRKLDDHSDRTFELEHSVIKLMRGLLQAMMRQSGKVEAFKSSLDPLDALHAKYDTPSGDTIVADDAWGHLQLDATSLYLLMLAQMTASGLSIIYTLDEVDFVQNLVFYISQTYRTPDYGIWERGDKTNHGAPELNASSVAMAKAALESLSGLNLFGLEGSEASVIHVLADDIARSRITLEALLPRESSSKEVDASLLSAIGFPAFAVDDKALEQRTREKIVSKLTGHYGLKRFLRDGHQTVIEDPERLHYEPEELRQFEAIESEWPLFDAYLALDGLFRFDADLAEVSLKKLARCAQERDDRLLLPELYIVPEAVLEAERAEPGSQARVPNDNLPLVWAQSLWILARLLHDQHLLLSDVDPLGRHTSRRAAEPVVQVALVVDNEALKYELASQGFQAETLEDIQPLQLSKARLLVDAYHELGSSVTLGLTGRPKQRVLSLATSRIYKFQTQSVVFVPAFLDQQAFYLSLDSAFLVERFVGELAYIRRNWVGLGRPTLVFLVTDALMNQDKEVLLELLGQLQSGRVADLPIKLAPLAFLSQRAAKERLDRLSGLGLERQGLSSPNKASFLQFAQTGHEPLNEEQERDLERIVEQSILSKRLKQSSNLYEAVELLECLLKQTSLDTELEANVSVEALLEDVYDTASSLRLWAVLRRAAGLLGKTDVAVTESVTDILVSQKSIVIGKAYTERSLIRKPITQLELMKKIHEFCRDDIRDFVFTQEMLIYLSLLMKAEPDLFKGFLTIRVGHLILLLVAELAQEEDVTQDEAYDMLMRQAPSHVQQRLRHVLTSYADASKHLEAQEAIQIHGEQATLVLPSQTTGVQKPDIGWWRWRQREGVLNRVPKDFYARVWRLMEHSDGLVIGDKLDRRNRLSSELLLAGMTAGEKNFALTIDHLLNKVNSADYKQLNIEALVVLQAITELNPSMKIKGYLVLDVLIGHAVRHAWMSKFPELVDYYEQDKASAWAAFYELAPAETGNAISKAFEFLLSFGEGNTVLIAGD